MIGGCGPEHEVVWRRRHWVEFLGEHPEPLIDRVEESDATGVQVAN
jgi:hypothetical protein